MGSGGKKTHTTYTTAPSAPPPPEPDETPTEPPPPAPPNPPDPGLLAMEEESPSPVAAEPPTPEPPAPEGALEEDVESSLAEASSGEATAEPRSTAEAAAGDAEAEEGSGEAPAAEPAVEPPPDVVTPIPEVPPEGYAPGVPVLVGGADLADSTATLISYASPDGAGPREVLLATVDEEAEAKLMDALALSEEKFVPVQVQEEINGRLPVDEDKQLYELVAKAAKSVNHKLKSGQSIPVHTQQYLAKATEAVNSVANDPNTSAEEQTMVAYYQAHLDAIAERIADPNTKPYQEGGKIPLVQPYEHTGLATVTKMMPAPAETPEPGQLVAAVRDASRIQASLDPTTGTASWNGTSRSTAKGKEYAIDLGEGWSAVYRPYGANDPAKHEFSLRGQLEIHAPQGAGHGTQLVRQLGSLNLVNRAMTHAEGEWTYLKNNIDAQNLTNDPQVTAALQQANALEELQLQELVHTHADQAVGLDKPALSKLAKQWQLEAAAACLPKKVRLVREAVAKATGHADGDSLATSPGYDPAPRASGGWLKWGRFDIGNNSAQIQTAWKDKSLVHSVSSGDVVELLATGVLASTERRTVMGIPSGQGTSEEADKYSGGANAVFTRVRSTPKQPTGAKLIWDDPSRLLNDTSIYGYNGDHFGALNPKSGHSTKGKTTDPLKMAKFTANDNEVMFKHGLDLLGAHAPSRIICPSSTQKKQVLNLLHDRGITHLAGKPISEVVQ